MELDQLKAMWKDTDKSRSSMSESGLHQMLSQDSKHPISIMKRNLRLEVFFLILIYGFIIWWILNEVGTYFIYFDIILLFLAATLFLIYARYKYKLLNNMECMSCEVKSNLRLQLKAIEKLVKLYFWASNIGVILIFLIAGAISYVKSEGDTFLLPHFLEMLIFFIIGAALGIVNYYLGRWYLFNLYGKHIQKLKNILYEMDDSETK